MLYPTELRGLYRRAKPFRGLLPWVRPDSLWGWSGVTPAAISAEQTDGAPQRSSPMPAELHCRTHPRDQYSFHCGYTYPSPNEFSGAAVPAALGLSLATCANTKSETS